MFIWNFWRWSVLTPGTSGNGVELSRHGVLRSGERVRSCHESQSVEISPLISRAFRGRHETPMTSIAAFWSNIWGLRTSRASCRSLGSKAMRIYRNSVASLESSHGALSPRGRNEGQLHQVSGSGETHRGQASSSSSDPRSPKM